MQDYLDSSLDSIELEIYHKPNPKIRSIMDYLRKSNLQFCTDPKKKQDDYYSNLTESVDQFSLRRNKFVNRKKPEISIDCPAL
ncbi:unnamed protein product (macronuclear) [Paramecium tetraurelia]|uniref:Uncharacterized protein n=1 Tax=Paramecium tetraurelia TaxID=5888 RepID=A0EDH9_PARTE|nr:uncharacterized protein GSPATT00004215001 [Paramecium tetraurelia]CAK93346.1 unnamed protein product [Paramecium tetraurelia]|eukprot:XP_001460743.1 hypothetical protein (macronuclear) [Paramecium tetraurelia strain d4-2]